MPFYLDSDPESDPDPEVSFPVRRTPGTGYGTMEELGDTLPEEEEESTERTPLLRKVIWIPNFTT